MGVAAEHHEPLHPMRPGPEDIRFQKWDSQMGSQRPPKVGRRIKGPKNRPWLGAGGEEIHTRELKEICKTWDQPTWERYLRWYESPSREKLVHPYRYDNSLEGLEEFPLQDFDQSTKQTKSALCERLLSNLSVYQQDVMRFYFFAGQSDAQIAPRLNRARASIQEQRIQALETLKRGIRGDNPSTCQFMRGKIDFIPSFWTTPFSFFLKNERVYQPKEQTGVQELIMPETLRRSFADLSHRQLRAIHLRFWCSQGIAEIARDLDLGINTTNILLESAVSSLKRNFVKHQTQFFPGERSPYAVEQALPEFDRKTK